MVNDDFYMSLAIKEAWKYQGLTYPNPAVGALILDRYEKILSIAAHKKKGLGHAEFEAIKEAYINLTGDKNINTIKDISSQHKYLLENHNNLFKGCKIYVTLEPCNHFGSTPPCSFLIKALGFKEVVIGSTETNGIAKGGIQTLKNSDIKIKLGVLQKECDELLYPFKKWQKDRFIFFKMAINLNGTYDTGIISSKNSREYVHKLRDKTDLLIIGGNTVRTDKPILDSRLIDGKAPDILIYSKQNSFDRSIALFNVPNRKVYISDSFDLAKKYNFIMIEGGEKMLEATKDIVDRYLFFISPSIKSGKSIQKDIKFSSVWITKLSDDIILWSKCL